MKFIIIFVFSSVLITQLFSSESLYESDKLFKDAVASIKDELPQERYEAELKIIIKFKRVFDENINRSTNLYEKDSGNRGEFLDSLLDIQQSTHSLIYSQYLINKSIALGQTVSKKGYKKYIFPGASILLKEGVCDGFSFMGDYYDKVKGDRKQALETYQYGQKICKVKWKIFEMLGKSNQLRYKMGLIK